METFLLYILKSGICLAIFYICFKALFSNDTFFRFNRWILLIGSGICMLLPLTHIKIPEITPIQRPMLQLEQLFAGNPTSMPENIQTDDIQTAGTPAKISTSVPILIKKETSWGKWAGIIYLGGYVFFLSTVCLSFYKMFRIIRTGINKKEGEYTLVLTSQPIAPFSWGYYIILSEEDYINNPEEILTHEKMHLHYRHSFDIIFIEIISIMQWFNPAAWLLKRELRDIHEYQADKGVLNQGIDATKYQLLLVKKAVGSSLYTLANSFNHSKIKKRITMMLKKKSNNWARLKLMLLVPVGFIALTVFARPEVESTRPVAETQVPPPPLPSALKQSKSTKSQNDDQKIYGLYLSFNEINENGQKTENITPPPPLQAPASSKKKEDVAPPPPPPLTPDVSVSISYNNEDKEQCFYVYNFFLKEDIKTQIDKIYNADIVAITIKPSKNAIADLPDRIEKAFKEKIKYDVKYEVIRK